GDYYNLARQAVSALLNACQQNVTYDYSKAEIQAAVVSMFNYGYATLDGVYYSSAGALAVEFDRANNQNCPLNNSNYHPGSNFTATSTSTLQGPDLANSHELRAYPTPFTDKAV